MNKIYTNNFRNAIGIGARAFRNDYEGGGVILLGGGKGWVAQPTITYPPHKTPPQRSQIIRGRAERDSYVLGREIMLSIIITHSLSP